MPQLFDPAYPDKQPACTCADWGMMGCLSTCAISIWEQQKREYLAKVSQHGNGEGIPDCVVVCGDADGPSTVGVDVQAKAVHVASGSNADGSASAAAKATEAIRQRIISKIRASAGMAGVPIGGQFVKDAGGNIDFDTENRITIDPGPYHTVRRYPGIHPAEVKRLSDAIKAGKWAVGCWEATILNPLGQPTREEWNAAYRKQESTFGRSVAADHTILSLSAKELVKHLAEDRKARFEGRARKCRIVGVAPEIVEVYRSLFADLGHHQRQALAGILADGTAPDTAAIRDALANPPDSVVGDKAYWIKHPFGYTYRDSKQELRAIGTQYPVQGLNLHVTRWEGDKSAGSGTSGPVQDQEPIASGSPDAADECVHCVVVEAEGLPNDLYERSKGMILHAQEHPK